MRTLLTILLTCVLLTTQVVAYKGHTLPWVVEKIHEIDNDELRIMSEESAESLREHFYVQKSRRPEIAQR
ncbi:MAG: DUF2554 family protein [Muribaculaceae bacterium]|nr:DUF2554 family protein [Escherichia coli]MCF0220577.1 DUF2554 family protein [Muribaculaceae bacterium]